MTGRQGGEYPIDAGEPRPEVRGLATVGSDVAAVTAARAGTFVLGTITIVVSTRLLGPAGYAEVALATVLATLVFATSSAWTAAAVSRYGREELEQRGSLRVTSWARLAITMPLLAVAAAVAVAMWAAGALPPELSGTLIALALASAAFLVLSEHVVSVLEAAGRMRTSALALLARAGLVTLGVGVAALAADDLTPELVVGIGAAASAVLAALSARWVWRQALWPPVADRSALRRIFWFSLPLIAFAASQYGMRSVDVVVLRAFEPLATVGIYAIAFQAFVMLVQLATTITIVVTPLLVSMRHAGREHELSRYLERIVPQATLVLGGLVALAAPFAALLIPVVLGTSFSDAADPLVILLGAWLIRAVASLAAPVLLLHERSGATAAINVGALAVNVCGDIVLVGLLGAGVVGPAIASTLAMVPIAAGYLLVAARATGARTRLPAVVALAPAAGIVATLVLPALAALGVAVAAVVAACALAVAGGMFSADDADLVERLRLPASWRRRIVAGLRSR